MSDQWPSVERSDIFTGKTLGPSPSRNYGDKFWHDYFFGLQARLAITGPIGYVATDLFMIVHGNVSSIKVVPDIFAHGDRTIRQISRSPCIYLVKSSR